MQLAARLEKPFSCRFAALPAGGTVERSNISTETQKSKNKIVIIEKSWAFFKRWNKTKQKKHQLFSQWCLPHVYKTQFNFYVLACVLPVGLNKTGHQTSSADPVWLFRENPPGYLMLKRCSLKEQTN